MNSVSAFTSRIEKSTKSNDLMLKAVTNTNKSLGVI